MEYIIPIITAFAGAVLGLSISQWWIWRIRAVNAAHEAQHYKANIDGMQQQLNLVADERKLHHETLEEVFDLINDNAWGINDSLMMSMRNKLMEVIRDSSVGRV